MSNNFAALRVQSVDWHAVRAKKTSRRRCGEEPLSPEESKPRPLWLIGPVDGTNQAKPSAPHIEFIPTHSGEFVCITMLLSMEYNISKILQECPALIHLTDFLASALNHILMT